jgi:hypothetical protein
MPIRPCAAKTGITTLPPRPLPLASSLLPVNYFPDPALLQPEQALEADQALRSQHRTCASAENHVDLEVERSSL